MADILCVTNGLPGILYSSLELARRLSVAGHRLTYASFAGARQTVEDHGFPFLPLPASRYEAFLEADARRGILERLWTLERRRGEGMEAMGVAAFAEAIGAIDPDLVLIDGEMHEHIIAGAASGAPMVLLNTFASIWKRPGMPPPHHPVRPGVGWKGSAAGISLLWLDLRLRKWRVAWSHRVRRVGCDRVSILRRLAARSGFDFRHRTDFGQWLIPFTYRGFPVLSLHALEFEFPHTPPEGVHYVGPMVGVGRVDSRVTGEDLSDLEAVFERRHSAGGRRKLIYAGFGSFFSTDVAWLRRLAVALTARGEWDLLISLGERATPADLGALPANAHVFPWVPQTAVLEHADVVVTHGGINTVDESVIAAVPLLIYCGAETDMAGNTARVVHHGIGIAGDRLRDGGEQMRLHVDRLLSEESFKRNLERLRSCYVAYAGNRVAERVVDVLLGGGRRVQKPAGDNR